MSSIKKFKKGAASFYIVAFSTLILVIIATSFATVILSEASRSENDDLSQSAYDSALAGIEDAKVAFSNYRRCVEAGQVGKKPTGGGTNITCEDIIWWMQNPDCYTVGHILGKIPKNEQSEVVVGGTTVATADGTETTNQAYTCVMVNTELDDYRATLNSNHMAQVIRAGVKDGGKNTVSKIRISWYSVRADNRKFLQYNNFSEKTEQVTFGALGDSTTISIPPTIEVQIVQTGTSFELSYFDITKADSTGDPRTNRATLYLVPYIEKIKTNKNNFIAAWNSSLKKNFITKEQVAKTNDHTVLNKPFVVYCNPETSDEFYCSAEIELPGVRGGGKRANDTFMIGVALPYQKPDTDFSIELICDGDDTCGGTQGGKIGDDTIVRIKNTQISIDSTGRANDLYRRVETRLETSDTAFGFGSPYYALQILGSGTTTKDLTVTSEYNFYF